MTRLAGMARLPHRPARWRARQSAWSRETSGRARRRESSDGLDLVDEPVVERLSRVEGAAAPHVLGYLVGRPAGDLGKARVESPEQLLLLPALLGDLVWRPGEARRRLDEAKARVRGSHAVAGGRHHTDGRANDLASAMHAQPRAEEIDGIDEDEGCLEGAVRAVQVELDGLVTASIQTHERRRRLAGGNVIEQAGDQHDPALEKLLLD